MKLFMTEKRLQAELEKRADSFTDQVVNSVLSANAQSASPARASATAALEIAAGLVGRAFASAEVQGDASELFDAATLHQIGRSLIRNGQWLGVVMPERNMIRAAAGWDITGSGPEGSWAYRVDFASPGGRLAQRTYPSRRVIHVRYAVPVDRPWTGLSPLQVASLAGELSAETVSLLRDEIRGPRGYLLPVPDSDGQADRVAGLRGDIAGLGGKLATIETQQSLASESGLRRSREWETTRIGAKPPPEIGMLAEMATREVLGACGIPLAMAIDSQGTALREAWRIFLFSTIAPLGKILAAELTRKIGQSNLGWEELRASDLAGRARAFQSMVGGGIEVDRAAALSGLLEGD